MATATEDTTGATPVTGTPLVVTVEAGTAVMAATMETTAADTATTATDTATMAVLGTGAGIVAMAMETVDMVEAGTVVTVADTAVMDQAGTADMVPETEHGVAEHPHEPHFIRFVQ